MNQAANQKPQVNPTISHYAYRNAYLMTGNVISDHQFSWIIPTKGHHQFSAEECIKHALKGLKPYLSNYQYGEILKNALNGVKQTVYVIRHNGIKQGVFVLDHTGSTLNVWHHLERTTTYKLMNEVIKLIGAKKQKHYASLVEKGCEHLAC